MLHYRKLFPLLPITLSLLLCSSFARAAIYTVGSGAGCTHPTIQSAIDSAELNPGFDTVRVSRTQSWTQQALVINTNQHLNLVGGFATCNQSPADGTPTIIDGAGGAQAPVLRITTGTGGIVKLRHLTIQGGDEDGAGYGGGIYFRGDGILEVIESTIANNSAGYGGGIYAEGTGPNAELILSNNVLIHFNTARLSGGGVYNDGVEMTMNAPDSWIAFNQATGLYNAGTGQWQGGYGGGIQIVGGARDGHTYIGSPGVGGAGPVYANEARYGGGISVMSVSENAGARLIVYSTDAQRQTAIRDNFASVAGGGLYLWAEDRGGFIIGHAAVARLHNASLLDNSAPEGAAAYLARTPGLFPVGFSALMFNSGNNMPAALPCPQDRPCSRIAGNFDLDLAGDPTGGSVLFVDRDNTLIMDRTELSGNRGGRIVRAVGGDTTVEAVNTLWADNEVSQQVIRTEDDVDLLFENSTLVGNAIGATHAISSNGRTRVQRSVLWQPGKTLVSHSGDPLFAQNIVANERQSLDGGNSPWVVATNPRFIDPANSDYRLRAASPAVDFAGSGGGPDLVGTDRGIDLPIKANRNGAGDLGAFERPALAPLLHNGNFDSNSIGRLNHWTEVTPGASSWTSDQNGIGTPGSGSIHVSQSNIPAPRVTARSQCIHLPGPGRYLLNGWGRSSANIATRDSVLLRWELRHSGSESCNAGQADASGEHFLPNGVVFAPAATPARIEVPESAWTHTSSLNIQLVVIDNGVTFPPAVSGWFDGITLEVESLDLIFADDFEQDTGPD